MILVTGGAGFIGSNLVAELNRKGLFDILVVDNLTDGRKALNLAKCCIADYEDKDRFFSEIENFMSPKTSYHGKLDRISQVFHLGACSRTTEWNGKYMMDTNFRASRLLLEFCEKIQIPLVYASSASVYGSGSGSDVNIADNENPLNVYGYSKLAFDQHVRQRQMRTTEKSSTVIGLRYFNVYGPNESHKNTMASVIYHLNQQLSVSDKIKLFSGSHGYAAGEQCRDFVHVDDVVDATIWAGDQSPLASGIYNCGTGVAETFNAVANAVLEFHGRGQIEYIPFPSELLSAYQANTKANIASLRNIGYSKDFKGIKSGVKEYLTWLSL